MKQIVLASLIVSLFVPSVFCDRTQYDPTKTQFTLPMLVENPDLGPIVIDGVINQTRGQDSSEAWESAYRWTVTPDSSLADGVMLGHMAAGKVPANADDLSFTVFTGFDSKYLYVGVVVNDLDNFTDNAADDSYNEGEIWKDDSVEIFIDGDNSNFPTRDATGSNPEIINTGGQYVIAYNNAHRDVEAGKPGFGENAAWYGRAEFSNSGYNVEFRILLSEIGNPQPGDILGFTVAVNDDDDGGDAERTMIWAGETHVEASYGNFIFGGKSIKAPKVSTPPTIDGVIHSSEYPGAVEQKVDWYSGMPSDYDDLWEAGDLAMSAWVEHDDVYIYVAINVIDDVVVTDTLPIPGTVGGNTWEDDGVEIYFDSDETNRHNYFGPSHLPRHEGNYNITANSTLGAPPTNPVYGDDAAADYYALASLTSTGYQVEFRVKKLALTIPGNDVLLDTFGFDFSANDDDVVDPDGTTGDRVGQFHWCGNANSERSYGFLTLSDDVTKVENWSVFH